MSARASCNGTPAAAAGRMPYGYPCFRKDAIPIVIIATDEAPITGADTFHTPAWSTIVKPVYQAAHARLVGILGSGFETGTDTDLRAMATDTGAVDSANGNAPLVFTGAGANASTAIHDAVVQSINGIPLGLAPVTVDDSSDSVDASAAFVDHLETQQLGTAQCANGLTASDTNGDTFADTFSAVRPGTAVCWKLVAKSNTAAPAQAAPQVFKATVKVLADGISQVDARDVVFVVPPANPDGP